ncbi:methionine ABC transporter ATP-binding protein [Halalkalibacter wakoensis JCM 9140]|uniref:Methionine ABC transporter ATP-binding protein n=1 Tax=Halalkalibacter wakoensis JCM 9140 TaxID=1236970 RepID=W4Q0K6_9BACI|nr:methionine ABC transporter ATP-binding protein [Halalkalibacter wakoensis]GAE25465.1 methionine ABC transporter ATP-binding protein [Halalkalibacter wakoensis JCM 9140]
MIELKNVSKTFVSKKSTVTALDDVSIHVQKGEIYGVIGYSGAGKSTLIRCVNMLEKPSGGEIIVNGVTMTGLSSNKLREARQNIGMIFQGFNLLKTATVYDNIAIPLKLTGIPKAEIDERVNKYLAVVGLEAKADSYPSQLSGGQKQRVAIARALSHEPDVLLSDEATSALDPETTESILSLLLKINKEFGITILLITHEMHVVQKICDRVAVMENGKVIEEGKVIDIFSQAKTDTTKKFINSLFPEDIPSEVINSLKEQGPIIRLSFVGQSTGKPALAEVSKKFNVYTNILSGNIVQLKNEPYGRMVIHLEGANEETEAAVRYLEEVGVQVERVNL